MVPPGHTARHLEVHCLVVESLRVDHPEDEIAPLRPRVRIADGSFGQAALEARKVLVEPERNPRVNGNDLVHAVAEDEAAIQHRDLRVLDGKKFSVQENHESLT